MGDVDNGIDDDSRIVGHQQAGEDEGRLAKENESDDSPAEQDLQGYGEEGERAPALASRSLSAYEEYEGIIPIPSLFNAYNPNAQEALLEIARTQVAASFADESARQDKLVEAEIRQSRNGQIISAVVILATIVSAAAISISTGRDAVAMVVLGIPIATIVGNLFRPVRSRKIDPPRK